MIKRYTFSLEDKKKEILVRKTKLRFPYTVIKVCRKENTKRERDGNNKERTIADT